MFHITPLDRPYNVVRRNRLRRIRRLAKARGFRVLRGYPGYSLIVRDIEPQRAVRGLCDTSLDSIEAALTTPLQKRKQAPKHAISTPAIVTTVEAEGIAP
jgi:hypothetical protein